MRYGIQILRAVVLGGLALLAGGCASTQLVGSWSKPGGIAHPFRKVVVMALLKRDDFRRELEDDFVAQLKAQGVEATPGYTLIPEAESASETQVKQTVEKTGADAVLIVGLVRVQRMADVTPGYMTPAPVYGGGYYGYYAWGWRSYYYQPTFVYQYNVLTLDSKLFDARQGDLIWAGRTETVDPSNPHKDLPELAGVIVKDLAKRDLIP